MKVDVEQVDACVRRLNIEVPADRVGREFNSFYRDLQKRVKIPGFRQGKVPRRVLEKHYGPSVEQEVIQKLVPDVLSEALTQEGINTIGQPSIDQIDLHKDEPLRFVATAQVLPDITIADYTDWQFERRLMAIEDSHIDNRLEQLRERHAELHTISDRALAEGDHAIVNYQGILEGELLEGGTGNNVTLELGAERFLPEIEQGLVGKEQGAELSIPVSFPADYNDTTLAGKTLDFQVTVLEIKEKVLPELDDEFASAFEEEETLEALRTRVRSELEEAVREQAKGAVQQDILVKLVEENPVDVPEILIHEHMRQLHLQQRRQETGQDPQEEDLQVDPHSLHDIYGDQALKAVRGQVILHHIEEELGVTITEDEVDDEVADLASRLAQNPEALKHSMERNGSLDGMRGRLRERKVFDALMETMKINDTILSEAELAAINEDESTTPPEEG